MSNIKNVRVELAKDLDPEEDIIVSARFALSRQELRRYVNTPSTWAEELQKDLKARIEKLLED